MGLLTTFLLLISSSTKTHSNKLFTGVMPDSPHIEEANPLLRESESDYRSSFEYSCNEIDFERNGDSENPLDWPYSFKCGIVALLSFMGFTMYVAFQAKQNFQLKLMFYLAHSLASR